MLWVHRGQLLNGFGVERSGKTSLRSLYLNLTFKDQFSSVAQSFPTVCNPMNCSTTGLPVHHQLPESTQTHIHWVSEAIQPSHPLSSPSPPALSLSQHQGLFKWVRRNIIMIKSNPTPARWVAHKLENNNTEEILSLLWRFWAPHQASQTKDPQMD